MDNSLRYAAITAPLLFLSVAVVHSQAPSATVPSRGQILHPSDSRPSFEVATIKPWKARPRSLNAPVPVKVDPGPHVRRQETDHVHFIGQIDLLILDAYHLPVGSEKRILNGPAWIDSESDRYEIDAKIDAATFAELQEMSPEQQVEQVSLMEQSLLADRFHLTLHFEVKGETPVYALVIAKGGSKLVQSEQGEKRQLTARGSDITAKAVTLDEFARSPLWTPIGNRIVVNQTGLTGSYDFELKWRSDLNTGQDASEEARDLPPLFNALRDELGLNLIESKAPLEVIVIDRITRPTAN